MLRPTKQGSIDEPLGAINKRANAFKDSIIALYKKVLHLQVLLACSSAENASLLPPEDESSEGVTSVPHLCEDCPTEEDIHELEQALAIGINGTEIDTQLRQILEPAQPEGVRFEKGGLSTVQTEAETQRANDVLKKLQIVHRPLPHPNINDWIFQLSFSRFATRTPQYLDWASTSSTRVLWVTGHAGSGKTALLNILVQHLKEQGAQSENTVAYVFCDSTLKSESRSFTTIVGSLIGQIIKNRPILVEHLKNKLSSTEKESIDHPNDFYAMSTLLCTLIQHHDFGTIYFVIDNMEAPCVEPPLDSGLSFDSIPRDPYGDTWGLVDMLRLIATTARSSDRVRWLVSTSDARMRSTVESQLNVEMHNGIEMGTIPEDWSGVPDNENHNNMATESETLATEHNKTMAKKPEPEAKNNKNTRRLRPAQTQIHISADLPEAHEVTKSYIFSKVRAMARKNRWGGKLQSQIREMLQKGSSGNLLWVDIACGAIKLQGLPWDAPRLLDSLSPGVPELYASMLEGLHGFGEQNEKFCQVVLTTAAVAFRPLTIIELADIVHAPVTDMTYLPAEVDLSTLIERMGFPFVEVRENMVLFKHSTARDFLRKDMKERGKLSEAHEAMIRRCLQTLSSRRRQRDIGESGPINYVAISWIRHLSGLDISQVSAVLKLVNEFLKGNFLAWVEMLASQRLVGRARKHLEITEKILREKVCRSIHVSLGV